MTADTKETLESAASTIRRCWSDPETLMEVLEIVYRLGYIDGGIAKTEAALEKMKEAA